MCCRDHEGGVGSPTASQLLTLLGALAGADPAAMAPGQARAELLTLIEVASSVQALIALRVDKFDTSRSAAADGLGSTRAWLRGFARLSLGAASALLSRGRLLRRMPKLAGQAVAGQVSAEHADRVVALANKLGGTNRLADF